MLVVTHALLIWEYTIIVGERVVAQIWIFILIEWDERRAKLV